MLTNRKKRNAILKEISNNLKNIRGDLKIIAKSKKFLSEEKVIHHYYNDKQKEREESDKERQLKGYIRNEFGSLESMETDVYELEASSEKRRQQLDLLYQCLKNRSRVDDKKGEVKLGNIKQPINKQPINKQPVKQLYSSVVMSNEIMELSITRSYDSMMESIRKIMEQYQQDVPRKSIGFLEASCRELRKERPFKCRFILLANWFKNIRYKIKRSFASEERKKQMDQERKRSIEGKGWDASPYDQGRNSCFIAAAMHFPESALQQSTTDSEVSVTRSASSSTSSTRAESGSVPSPVEPGLRRPSP